MLIPPNVWVFADRVGYTWNVECIQEIIMMLELAKQPWNQKELSFNSTQNNDCSSLVVYSENDNGKTPTGRLVSDKDRDRGR